MLGQRFNHLPEVVKNLLIINGLFFLATWALQDKGIDLVNSGQVKQLFYGK